MLFASKVGWNPGGCVGIFSNPLEYNLFIFFSLSSHLGRRKLWFISPLSEEDKNETNKTQQASEIQSLK